MGRDRHRRPPDTGDLAADLHTQLTEVIGILTPPHTSPAAGLIAEALQDPDLGRDLRERIVEPRIAKFKERLRQAQLSPETDLGVALDLLYGPLYHRLAQTPPSDAQPHRPRKVTQLAPTESDAGEDARKRPTWPSVMAGP